MLALYIHINSRKKKDLLKQKKLLENSANLRPSFFQAAPH